jgi:hypothetical protein
MLAALTWKLPATAEDSVAPRSKLRPTIRALDASRSQPQPTVRVVDASSSKLPPTTSVLDASTSNMPRDHLRAPAWSSRARSRTTPVWVEARALGLIDEVVAAEQLLARACERARELAALPTAAYAQVKLGWRRPTIEAIARTSDAVAEQWLDTWFSDAAQVRLRGIVEQLRAKG